MPTLNRFPLLGLWAKEAARRLGYTKDAAQALGHAHAVLYAIRAQARSKPAKEQPPPARPARKRARAKQLRFGGDDLDVTYDAQEKVRGLVGGGKPQTAKSYQASVQQKFPPGYYARLEKCFRRFFKKIPPSNLKGRKVYNLYDEWKKTSGVGRLVDLDKLLQWCHERTQ